MHLFHPGPLFGLWANAKRAIPEKLKSVPRPCWILLISTHFDRNHCFATQGEYFSHGDVSRGHPRTIYNRSWNLTDNSNFPRTQMETLIWQSRVQPWVVDMRHQTNSGKSATGSNTHACNFNFQHTHIENMFFPPEPLFGPWPIVIGAIPEILKSVPRPCCILLIFIGFDGSHGFAT